MIVEPNLNDVEVKSKLIDVRCSMRQKSLKAICLLIVCGTLLYLQVVFSLIVWNSIRTSGGPTIFLENVIDDVIDPVSSMYSAINHKDVPRIQRIGLLFPIVLHAENSIGNTPLIYACKRGDVEVITKLIELDSDVNDSNSSGITPLHNAVRFGNIEVVQLLIDHDANVNAMTKGNTSVLAYSYRYCKNSDGIISLLLENGAEL